ncbi:MAG: hypothetical protein HN368_23420 [Spirochaetales bacterium]|jgi:uncharacterized membrane protein|nr:hypothetical protein [Spirochaetales bacterium]
MEKPVLYFGDDALQGAAGYLAAVMGHYGIQFIHIPSGISITEANQQSRVEKIDLGNAGLFILSDYLRDTLTDENRDRIINQVHKGTGLLMIGGWESFFGGGYAGSELEELLPVTMMTQDDRINCPYPCVLRQKTPHEITNGLPFTTPPGIGGYNQVTAKPESKVILDAQRFKTTYEPDLIFTRSGSADPLLVVGNSGKGRTAALMTDSAPHWVGGFVDWGSKRVRYTVENNLVEVGNWYAEFFSNLVRWCVAT